MLPVSVGLGLINIDLSSTRMIGWLISDQAPRAIDAAFRIYMLPQGMFSVAVATVLFPRSAGWPRARDLAGLAPRSASACGRSLSADPGRGGDRWCWPSRSAAGVPARRVRRRSTLTAEALFWFSFSLPFGGINLC